MKNKLITYQGGGYDGCIWEWNFGIFDDDGEFHDIYSSGCDGCENEKEMIEFINDTHNIKHGNFSIWDMSKKEYGFTNILMGGIVVELVRRLNDDFWDYGMIPHEVTYECDGCKNDVGSFGGLSVNPVGCGGIVIMDDTKICEECYSLDRCFNCGEYESGLNETLNINGYCQNCYDDDGDMDVVVVQKIDEYDELEIDEEYKVWEYHRNSNDILTDITIVMGRWNDEYEKFPVELFNVDYGVINPHQMRLIS